MIGVMECNGSGMAVQSSDRGVQWEWEGGARVVRMERGQEDGGCLRRRREGSPCVVLRCKVGLTLRVNPCWLGPEGEPLLAKP